MGRSTTGATRTVFKRNVRDVRTWDVTDGVTIRVRGDRLSVELGHRHPLSVPPWLVPFLTKIQVSLWDLVGFIEKNEDYVLLHQCDLDRVTDIHVTNGVDMTKKQASEFIQLVSSFFKNKRLTWDDTSATIKDKNNKKITLSDVDMDMKRK